MQRQVEQGMRQNKQEQIHRFKCAVDLQVRGSHVQVFVFRVCDLHLDICYIGYILKVKNSPHFIAERSISHIFTCHRVFVKSSNE